MRIYAILMKIQRRVDKQDVTTDGNTFRLGWDWDTLARDRGLWILRSNVRRVGDRSLGVRHCINSRTYGVCGDGYSSLWWPELTLQALGSPCRLRGQSPWLPVSYFSKSKNLYFKPSCSPSCWNTIFLNSSYGGKKASPSASSSIIVKYNLSATGNARS